MNGPPASIMDRTPMNAPARDTGPRAAAVRTVRVTAVVPCHNRPDDLRTLLADLAALSLRDSSVVVDLRTIVVDNSSDPPLTLDGAGGLAAELLRVPSNRGGSGGFNSGMRHALSGDAASQPDFLWLIDSDARVDPSTLVALAARLASRPDVCALGPALADPITREVFEIGGTVCRRTGRFGPERTSPVAGTDDDLITCDYAASCCLLVRADAVRSVGLMPDVFLNGDDVEWCIRLSDQTGLHVAVDPSARAYHPRFDRFPTWARYYHARNGFGVIAALGLGRRVRFRRALSETAHAVNQAMMARKDLARLQLAGLSDAAFRHRGGPAPEGVIRFEKFRPLSQLREALGHTDAGRTLGRRVWIHPDLRFTPSQARVLCEQLGLDEHIERELNARGGPPSEPTRAARRRGWRRFVKRLLKGPKDHLAIVPAKGGPSAWISGHIVVQVAADGFVARRASRSAAISRVARMGARGLWLSLVIAAMPSRPSRLPRAAESSGEVRRAETSDPSAGLSLSIIVLSYNRRVSLGETLRALLAAPQSGDAEILVVDNGSTDGSVPMVREEFPGVRLIAREQNAGVAGFNAGVEAAGGDVVLVLDDDAQPEPASLGMAMGLMRDRPEVAGVALLPRHPETGAAEWPGAAGRTRAQDDFPMMGCGNLIRRRAWLRVGGYEKGYFLYRNDADMALKLLGAGMVVHYNPAWVVWHDSPAAVAKPVRWLRLATRNWVWMARRHGRGLTGLIGMFGGVAWAFTLAGLSAPRLTTVLRGAWEGLTQPAPPLPSIVKPDGKAFWSLVKWQLRSRG